MPAASLELDVTEVERALRLLTDPGATFEIRALGEERGHAVTWSGYFRDPAVAAREIRKVERNAIGVYVTLNPVTPQLHARCANRIGRPGKGGTTGDQHIVKRTRLLVDIDAVPVAGISATDEEHDAALSIASEIWDDRARAGWPEPLRADSGNGGHLVYAVDLPTEDDGLVQRALEKLASVWNCEVGGVRLKVDTKVFNPSRISKVYGSVSRKGDDDIDGRLHRVSRIIAAPDVLHAVTREQLEEFAGAAPTKQTAPTREAKHRVGDPLPTLDVQSWVAKHGLTVKGTHPNKDGGTVYELEVCPFNADHNRGEAWVIQLGSGAISAGCQHESCRWNWDELRERYDGPRQTRSSGDRTYRDPQPHDPREPHPNAPPGWTPTIIDGGATPREPAPEPSAPAPDSFAAKIATALTDIRRELARADAARQPLFAMDAVDLLAQTFGETQWLATGIITIGGVFMIGAEPKATKTWLGTEVSLAIATGTPVCGEFFAKAGVVAYFYAEDMDRHIKNRIRSLLDGRGRQIERGRFYPCPRGKFLDITRDDDLAWVLASAREVHGLDFLMLDPLRDIHTASEDKSDEMSPVMKRLKVLGKLAGCTVGVVHHSGKFTETSAKRRGGQRMRGSSAIHGSADSALYLMDTENDTNIFKNTVESEIKGARSAGTFALTLTVGDDENGEAITAKWDIERISKAKKKEESEQEQSDKVAKIKTAIIAKVRKLGDLATSRNAIAGAMNSNRKATLRIIADMLDADELVVRGKVITVPLGAP